MSRLRTIKPGFFLDEELAECQPLARLLFGGLWVIADRDGRLEDRPKRIKIECLPYDECDVDELLWELNAGRFIVRYEVHETRYIAIPKWAKHQNPHIKEAASTIPAPDKNSARHNPGDDEPGRSCPVSCNQGLVLTAPGPVDNSPSVDNSQVKGGCDAETEPLPPVGGGQVDNAAASHAATNDNVGTCDGNPCLAHDFPASAFAPLRRAHLVSLHPEQQKEVGTKGKLDALLEAYAAHVCAACHAAFGEFERPQLDGMCEQAVVAAVESLKGSQDVTAVMKSRLLRFGLADLIGDRKLEELRRTKRNKRRKGEPVRIGATLPAVERGAP